MRVSLHRNCLLSMILANIFVHLFYAKRLPILMCKINNIVDLERDAIIQQFKKSEKKIHVLPRCSQTTIIWVFDNIYRM